MDECKIASLNGLELSAVVQRSSDNTDQNTPLVILLHGNTGWKEEEHLATLAEQLADAGIMSVRFDAPGSGESDGTWEDDYRVSNYIDATKDVYEYMIENYPVDPNRVGIWGHSMGGLVAVQVVARHPERFAALCGSQLSSGRISDAHATFGDTTDGDVKMETEIFGTITLPKEFFDDRNQFSTVECLKNVHVPILFIAGTRDDFVPAHDVKTMFEQANEPKEYAEFPVNHFYKRDLENLKKINDVTVTFFEKCIK